MSTDKLPVQTPKESPRVQDAKFKAMTARNRIEELARLAPELMPAFVFKFDYSNPEDYDKLADYAHKAADALLKKRQTLLSEVSAKLSSDLETAQKLDAAEKQVVQTEETT